MVTKFGARTLGIQDNYGIAVGKPANLIVLDAYSPYEAILERATVKTVISKGQIIAETTPPAHQMARPQALKTHRRGKPPWLPSFFLPSFSLLSTLFLPSFCLLPSSIQ